MVRPEVRAVESKRATRERNTRQVLHVGRLLPRVETADAPILVRFFYTAQDVNQSIDEHMSANLRANINDAQNVSARIEFENAMIVPLTQVKMIAVEAAILTGKLPARDPSFSEPARRIEAARIPIIFH